MKNSAIVLALASVLCGCATNTLSTKDQEYLVATGYGAYPENYQQIIKDYCSQFLKDPYSAQYTFSIPSADYVRKGLIFGGAIEAAGWRVNVGLNAKNSFGGYVGETQYAFFIRDGKVIRVFESVNGKWWPADGLR